MPRVIRKNDVHRYSLEIWHDGVYQEADVVFESTDEDLRNNILTLRKSYPPEDLWELKNCRVDEEEVRPWNM